MNRPKKNNEGDMMEKEAGHTFLARLGKTRLRPGGKEATDWLLAHGHFTKETKVLEVACNMGTTMIELVEKYHCQVTGIDLDQKVIAKAQKNIEKHGLTDKITAKRGNAFKLPFEAETFDVVINEAMLTMFPYASKQKAIKEYYRVLKPGGILLTHDVRLIKDDPQLVTQLGQTINVHATPLTKENWEELFSQQGFEVTSKVGPMSLMSPAGMIRDEGFLGTLKIVKNGLKKENRAQFKAMHHLFSSNKDNFNYIAVASVKPK
ncbi:type 11 methyltransferase [Ligilactobacillus apodemi DSM 16634 = JCM 16172]|uniref:Type 11 methyltransferase n=2 Tax=Ligilactobacillus TaxID=2767887 RepID=A0A0R1TT50_9LACO|nr:type 11 methyltransferase [Ligilactobacillus apodemi DSM 16634 = JCM 16172]